MCGRYVSPDESVLNREYPLERRTLHANAEQLDRLFHQSFNVAPTQHVPVVRVMRNSNGTYESLLMRWGLIPFWAHGQPPRGSTINARLENIETAPTWRDAWRLGRRCIMPCAGFYEWQLQPDGKTKQPFYIKPVEGETFALAAIWDRSLTPLNEEVVSCAVITMPANELMADIHNTQQRMPAILLKENIATWLKGTAAAAKATLVPYPSDHMLAWPVSTQVNSPKNDGPALIQPLRDAL